MAIREILFKDLEEHITMCFHRAESRQGSSSPPSPTSAACCPPPPGRPPAVARGQVPAQADGPQTESPPKNKNLENKEGSWYKIYLTEVQRDPKHHWGQPVEAEERVEQPPSPPTTPSGPRSRAPVDSMPRRVNYQGHLHLLRAVQAHHLVHHTLEILHQELDTRGEGRRLCAAMATTSHTWNNIKCEGKWKHGAW